MATFAGKTVSSVTSKIVLVGVLTCVLFVPLLMIAGLTAERQARRSAVALELETVWGQRQTTGGVALVVPYQIFAPDRPGVVVANGRVIVLPRTLSVKADLTPEVRRRSIFAVNLYRTALDVEGRFAAPDLAKLGLVNAELVWDRAVFHIGVADLRGVVSTTPVTWGAATLDLEPAGEGGPFGAGLRAPAPLAMDETGAAFRVALVVAGSSAIRFVPTGDATTVALTSPWPHPSFAGAFLPADQSVSDSGFSATWRLSALSRPYPQTWVQGAPPDQAVADRFRSSSFGVDLMTMVDHYQQVTRALKYGFLFIAMTFGIFLAWEMIGNLRLHPVQYLFVGLTLVVFFLLLLSFSEQVSFAAAYAVAASATILSVAAYAARILAAGRAGVTVGGWLTALYGVLFVLLQLEDLALLVGSVFVFLILVGMMYLTRKVDWYGLAHSPDGSEPGPGAMGAAR